MKRRTLKKLSVSMLVCAYGFGLYQPPITTASSEAAAVAQPSFDAYVTIDASAKHQKIDNFGASDAWSMEPLGKYWSEENKTRVADLLFDREKGIGLSAWRFNIGAGSTETDQAIITNPWRRAEAFKMSKEASYDWSKQAGQQWFLKAAKDRGVGTLIAFSNSPPVWMTKNGHAQPDASVGSTNLKEGYEDEFAAYLSDVLEHFKQEGLQFQYISPINEPTWDWNKANQEGNRYNNEDLKKVILELHRQLQERGISAQISAPDGVEITALLDDEYYKEFTGGSTEYKGGANSLGQGEYKEYIEELLGTPEMKAAVGNKIASHSYWSDYSKPGDDRLGKLRELLDANLKKYDPAAKYWMTEYCILGDYGPRRDLGIDPALYIARTIHFDLTKANAAAWQWWTAVSKEDYKDGLIYTDFVREGDEQNILPSKMLWALGNYSKFIRPGAERVTLTGLDEQARSGLLGSAYVHEGEETVTAVFVNDTQQDKRIKVSLAGLGDKAAVHALKSYVTSAGKDLVRSQDAPALEDGTFETVIPARSVTTLYGDVLKEQKKPEAPVITQVTPLNKALKVEFQAPKGASEYVVRYGAANDIKEQELTFMSGDEVVLRGLTNGTNYFVTVRAGNGNGYGPPSHRAYGTPALQTPKGVAAVGVDGGFKVSVAAEEGVTDYRVRYGTERGVYPYTSAAGPMPLALDGLTNGTTYYGIVEAVDGSYNSPATDEFAVMPDVAAPSKVLAVPGDQTAHVEFNKSDSATVTGYTVEVFADGKPVSTIETDQTSIDLTGLSIGIPAAIRVSSNGVGGKGTRFAETIVTPGAETVKMADPFDNGDMAGYQQDVSTWVIRDGLLQHTSGGDHQGEIRVKDQTIVDGTITAIAKHATNGADWGITFRGESYAKGYMFGFENGNLFLRRDGQSLAPSEPFTAKLGELYKLDVKLEGKKIRAYVDGRLVFDVQDTVYTGGHVGLHSWADAQFAYLKVANTEADFEAKPEIYTVKAGDKQVFLQYSQVEGADSYAIRYKPVMGESTEYTDAPVTIPGITTVTGLINDVTYSFSVVAKRGAVEYASDPVEAAPSASANPLLFYVDAGDGTPNQLENGESFGYLQSVEEQPYGSDPLTGIKWGYVADDGLTWARTDPTDAYETIRQYDGNTDGKGLAYRFEIPNGTYKVTVGFFDPWTDNNRRMNLLINGETKLTNYVTGSKREAQTFEGIEVKNGELVVKVVKAGGSKPMLSWIKIER